MHHFALFLLLGGVAMHVVSRDRRMIVFVEGELITIQLLPGMGCGLCLDAFAFHHFSLIFDCPFLPSFISLSLDLDLLAEGQCSYIINLHQP